MKVRRVVFFWRCEIGGGNNAQQQNQAAQNQIAQQKQNALTSLQQFVAANPGPLSQVTASQAPTQFGGNVQGTQFGGGGKMYAPQQPPQNAQPGMMQNNMARRTLPGMQPGQQGQQPQAGAPGGGGSAQPGAVNAPGLLRLLAQ